MNVKSYAGRILCDMSAYIDLTSDTSHTPSWWYSCEKNLQNDIYGIYQGRGEGPSNAVVIGEKGLHIFIDEEWTLLPYKLIEVIPPPKDSSDGLLVRISDKVTKLPVNDCLSDIFEFWRFLMRSQEAVKKK